MSNAFIAALAALTPVSAPPVPADVVFQGPVAGHVLAARAGAAPVLIARGAGKPSRSADGRTIAYVTRRGRAVVVREGRRTTVTHRTAEGRRPVSGVDDVALAPSAERLLVGTARGWRALDLATGTVRPVHDDELAEPRLSPDGRSAAWTDFDAAYVRPVDRAAPPRRLPCDQPMAVTWLGREIVALCGPWNAKRLVGIDPDSGATRTIPARLSERAADLGVTFGGRLLTVLDVTESRDVDQITVFDVDGRQVRTIHEGPGVLDVDLAFSVDGRTLHFTRGIDLLRIDLATSRERLVARDVLYPA